MWNSNCLLRFPKGKGADVSCSWKSNCLIRPLEVVYVGVVSSHHLPVASMMIQAGKHVLCEKPLCMNVKETKQLIQLAKEKKVFLMEVR